MGCSGRPRRFHHSTTLVLLRIVGGWGNNDCELALLRAYTETSTYLDCRICWRIFGYSLPQDPLLNNLGETHVKDPRLAGLLPGGTQLRGVYRGNEYTAQVTQEGKIDVEGREFGAPTTAALSATKGGIRHGWKFWKYIGKDGDWIKLDELRKRQG